MPFLAESCVEDCAKSLKSVFTKKEKEVKEEMVDETIVKLEECFAFIGKNFYKDMGNLSVMKAMAELIEKAFVQPILKCNDNLDTRKH